MAGMMTNFEPRYTVADAIDELVAQYRSGELIETDQCYTVKWMKHLGLAASRGITPQGGSSPQVVT